MKGGIAIVQKVFCVSKKEKDRYLKDGYAIVALSHFSPDGAFSYHLEKGSKWSRMLGSK